MKKEMVPSPDNSWICVARPWRWACHRATAGGWIRGVLEQYVAGFKPRGRPGGRSYSRSQQPIHELSGLVQVKRTPYRLQKGRISCNNNRCLHALSRAKWWFSRLKCCSSIWQSKW